MLTKFFTSKFNLSLTASLFLSVLLPLETLASEVSQGVDLTGSNLGYLAITIFVLAYIFVIAEEKLHLKKSKPVVVAAGLIWLLVGISYAAAGQSELADKIISHNLLEFVELF